MTTTCQGCRDGSAFTTQITMAFQPIANARDHSVFAYEALVRGADGASAASVLGSVSEDERYAFDQACRVTAIELAAQLELAQAGSHLSINFMPNAVYEPRACIRLTLAAAMQARFPLDRIIFEFTEGERVDPAHLLNILRCYRSMGFKTAIDDFGAGYAGLELLAHFQPDFVKLDMGLIRDIDTSSVKRSIVAHTLSMLRDLDVTPICEGVETVGEYQTLREMGVDLIQGYLLARPLVAGLPEPVFPGAEQDAETYVA